MCLQILQQQLVLFAEGLPVSSEEDVEQKAKPRHEEKGERPSQSGLRPPILRNEKNDRNERIHAERDRYDLGKGTHASPPCLRLL